MDLWISTRTPKLIVAERLAGQHARAVKLAVDEAIQQRLPKASLQQIAGQKLMLLILKRHRGVAR